MKKFGFLLLVIMIASVAGCASKKTNESETANANLVASEKTLPGSFEEMAAEQDPKNFSAEKVTNEDEYKELWKEFQLQGEIADVDFESHDVLFIGMFEPSSCPYEIDTMKTEEDELTINFSATDDVCTADLSPRNFVIAVDKGLSGGVSSILLVQEDQRIHLPIQTKSEAQHPGDSSSEEDEDMTESEGIIEDISPDRFTISTDTENRIVILTKKMEKDQLDRLKAGRKVKVTHASSMTFSEPPQTVGESVEILEEP